MHDHAATHDHGCGGAEEAIARAERLCRERDLQFTRLRRDVLAAVAGQTRPMGAYDIAEALSEPGRRVAAVSVYRALDFLTEHGLVHRIASRNAFVSCGHSHTEGAGLVFLICRNCGTIDETTSPGVEDQLGRTLAKAGFKPTSRILEVEGECGVSQAWFTTIYNVLFGEARGPRFGSFIALYGVAETRALIAQALAGAFLPDAPAP